MKYSIIKNFLNDVELKESLEFHSKVFYKQSKIYEILSNQIKDYYIFDSIQEKIKILLHKNTNLSFYFSKLWIGYNTHTNTNNTELPFIPHFDKIRHLKGMVYLNDVTLDNGPIHISHHEYEWIEKIRLNLPSDYKKLGLNSQPLSEIEKLKPIVGEKNTLILFDTNTPHNAGKVMQNKFRKFLRFDYIVDI